MPTGYAINGTCAADANEVLAQFNLAFPQYDSRTMISVKSATFGQDAGGNPTISGVFYQQGLMGSGSYPNQPYVMYLPVCDMAASQSRNVQMFNDGMQIGWGIVAAMAGALAVIFLKKSFFR